jgi:SAM-dependent methyltransferase
MDTKNNQIFDCDLCGSGSYTVLEVAKKYIGDNEPPVVCNECGFCYVRTRRPASVIAEDWNAIFGEGYTSEWPGVKARLFYVAEFFDQNYGWRGKRVLDIGAGEGTFLKFVQQRDAWISGLDPSEDNCDKLADLGATGYCQTIEDYFPAKDKGSFDVVTILWTLENCQDCMRMLRFAKECLKPNGHLMVATGSRLLVPFKKPLSSYFSENPADLHCFRWSAVTLERALVTAGFRIQSNNDYMQSDCLVMVGTPGTSEPIRTPDPPFDVEGYFNRWDCEFP